MVSGSEALNMDDASLVNLKCAKVDDLSLLRRITKNAKKLETLQFLHEQEVRTIHEETKLH